MSLNKKYSGLSVGELNRCFIEACKNGHFEAVRYLLTSSELKENVDINIEKDYGLRWVCYNGHY